MGNNQYKKLKAKQHNMARLEKLAYEMDSALFPRPKTTRSERMAARQARLSKEAIMCGIAFAMSTEEQS